MFIHVYSCIFIYVFIYKVITGNIYRISLLGEDYLSYLELVSNPFDLINKICSIHTIRWFFPSMVDSFNSSIRFAIETDNTK